MYNNVIPKEPVFLKRFQTYVIDMYMGNIYYNDSVKKYDSYEDFLEKTSHYWIETHIGNYKNHKHYIEEYSFYYRGSVSKKCFLTHFLEDTCGNIIKREKILYDKNLLIKKEEGKKYNQLPVFRRDYIPRTKKYKASGRCFRKVKTTQERREWDKLQYEVSECDCKINYRMKRSPANLANPWDDIPFSYWNLKNWKRFRKTQYKAGS